MTIQQSITIKADPESVYNALIFDKIFSDLTGAAASIENREGGAFSCFGGQIIGRNIELEPKELIIQAWRAAPWPADAYSVVVFRLQPSDGGTSIEMTHNGYPKDASEHLEDGWHNMYWGPLRAYLE